MTELRGLREGLLCGVLTFDQAGDEMITSGQVMEVKHCKFLAETVARHGWTVVLHCSRNALLRDRKSRDSRDNEGKFW